MKSVLLISILSVACFARANTFWNPVKLQGQCRGQKTNLITPFVGVDPNQAFGVFMRNDGVMGTEERPFHIRGQHGRIYISTPDTQLSFSIPNQNIGTKVYFEFSSRLGIKSQERDQFECQLEFL